MTDYFGTYFSDLTGYMPNCTETYIIDLIKQYSNTQNINSIFSKMGININNYGTSWSANTIPGNVATIAISISASGQYQTTVCITDNENNIGYIYVSSDYGTTWGQRGELRDWQSVSVSSTGQYQTAVVRNGYVYVSSDYGTTWTPRGELRTWKDISVSSTGQYQTAIVGDGYIYVSSDYGNNWAQRNEIRTWNDISISASGQYQTAVVYNGYVYASSDYGTTWAPRDEIRVWISVSVSSTGQYQTAVVDTGYIYVSSDYGTTWAPRDEIRIHRSGVSISATGQYQISLITPSEQPIIVKTLCSTDFGKSWYVAVDNQGGVDVSMSSSGQVISVVNGSGGDNIRVSNNAGFLNLSNVIQQAPEHSVGSPGNISGMMAVDSDYFYYCTGGYDGISDIWKRIAWDGTPW